MERVSSDSKKVQGQIEQFYVSLAKIQKESSQSISLLSGIDKVKDRMEECLSSLKSADALLQSNKKLEDLRSSDDVKEIAKQIKATKENLAILGDLPQFNSTQQKLEQLQNRLEGMARPLLSTSLEQRNGEDIRMLIDLFNQMQREVELQEYVFEFYVARVADLWKNLTNTIQESVTPFTAALSTFYGELENLLDKEIRWANKLLPAHFSFTSRFVNKAMAKVEGSYKSFIEQQTDAGENCSENLIKIWQVALHFANQTLEILDSLDGDQRLSVVQAIFSPFLPFQSNFSKIISKRMNYELQHSILIKPQEFSQTIIWLEERIPRLFHLCEEATSECLAFTGGCDIESFIKSLSDSFVTFLNNWLEVLQSLRVQSNVDLQDPVADIKAASSYETFSHDWTFVQGALQILRCSNLFSSKFNAFEGFLRNKFTAQGHVLLKPATKPSADLLYYQARVQKQKNQFSSFIEHLTDVAYKLLPTPHRMFVTFDTRVQSFVFDTMFLFIREKLESVPKLSNWGASSQVSPAGIEMPVFSLSPLPYVTQIGEHLFALPQQLAPFASGEGSVGDEEEDIDTGFVSQWLQHISSNTMSLYLQKICQIPKLSPTGAKQLLTDIEYLCEVLSPFGIQVEPSLQICVDFLRTPAEEYTEFLQTITDQASVKIGVAVGKMRTSVSLPSNLKESQ
uniref:Conserved oligomeric Golgi complex subunit 7 n=1 Tax=Vannella robusta TaxID=1487602 RepID=A0A7S4IKY9_9EUKA|mmetsp:Transcript_4303/g.5301  ORF Transcript_4303/g.5301 Transcript_4303/m.5301 type:complete len:681 (+) Transcript_4303:243-2285(+)